MQRQKSWITDKIIKIKCKIHSSTKPINLYFSFTCSHSHTQTHSCNLNKALVNLKIQVDQTTISPPFCCIWYQNQVFKSAKTKNTVFNVHTLCVSVCTLSQSYIYKKEIETKNDSYYYCYRSRFNWTKRSSVSKVVSKNIILIAHIYKEYTSTLLRLQENYDGYVHTHTDRCHTVHADVSFSDISRHTHIHIRFFKFRLLLSSF